MGVTFKKKAKETIKLKPVVVQEEQGTEGDVDEAVLLEVQIAALKAKMKPLQKKLEDKKKFFRDQCQSTDKDTIATFEGNEGGMVKVGIVPSSSEIFASPDDIFDIVGEQIFKELVKFGVTDLKKYCSVPQLKKIMKTVQDGTRAVSIVLPEKAEK